VASWLLCLLAVASVAVLVAGRVADQIRRVGLLKAVGATPGLVAMVFLAEYLVLALAAAAVGLVAGRLLAPLLTNPGVGLLGTAGAPPMTPSTVAVVAVVALAVAATATLLPAVRAARTSTVPALADAARLPRRRGWLVAISARLPVPLLLALRLAGRRPRRILLSVFSVAVTVSGIVAVLIVHAHDDQRFAASTLADPRIERLNEVLMVFTVALVALAAVNALLITWATVVDARRSSAVARALGATPGQVSAGLSGAQVLPALIGALLGIPGGFGLVNAVRHNASSVVTTPPIWWLVAVVIGTVAAVAALTAVPARIGARRSVAVVLQTE
jgi:putative ABC transport system permease protein